MSRLTRVLLISAAVLLAPALAACSGGAMDQATAQLVRQIGDPDQGRELIIRTGCGSCHEIPGVLGADGLVGPPLERIARRQFIAGVLRNTPDNMIHWLRFPQQVVPGNAMPDMGLSDADARQIAAYLYTLN